MLVRGVLHVRNKFTGEHSCRSAISIKFQINFIEIRLRHGYSPLNLLHIFRTPFSTNISGGWLLLKVIITITFTVKHKKTKHRNSFRIKFIITWDPIDKRTFFRFFFFKQKKFKTCIKNIIVKKLLYTPKDYAITRVWIQIEEKQYTTVSR